MDRLREPDGCPWDRAQTMLDLKGYLLEEAYEVVEALDSGDPDALREELGDLLFQVVFLSRIASEQGHFTVEDVILGITDKMIRRHPHVFGEARAETPGEVLRQWEEIKKAERSGRDDPSALDGVPRSLPALLRAHRLAVKAARTGFDWQGPREVLEKVDEEIAEVREALQEGGSAAAAEEVGDLLFAAASLARHLGVDPESALQQANHKFTRRFRRMEQLMRHRPAGEGELSIEEMEAIWRQAKREDPGPAPGAAAGDAGER